MAAACLHTLRCVVFVLNLFFWLAGLGTLALGLWLRFDPEVSELVTLRGGTENFHFVCYLLIAAGAIMTTIGFLGCCGAWRYSQGMLVAFFVVLVAVFCLELACAIIAYSQQEQIKRYIENSMYDIIKDHYSTNADYADFVDRIQNKLGCCGVKSYRDWLHSSWGQDKAGRTELGIGSSPYGKVPKSCCNEDGLRDYPLDCGISFDKLELSTYERFLHTKGCGEALYESAYRNLHIVIAVCVAVGAIQLIGMFLSMLLCCWISTSTKRKESY